MSLAETSSTNFAKANRRTKETATKTEADANEINLFWVLAVLLIGCWVAATVVFGLAGLYLFALALVPAMLVVLVLISWS